MRFGYLTGWRKGEIARLTWRDIEGDVIRLRPEHAKNKHGRMVILVGELAEIIAQRRALRRETIPWVFFREDGQPVRRFYRAWKTACRQAGLPVDAPEERKRFHDLRRTTARDLSRAGVPDRIAMSIMGHKTRSMYDRYNIVNEEDIRQAISQAEQHRARRSCNLATSSIEPDKKEQEGQQ